jgi:PST family polysaccharide transporter
VTGAAQDAAVDKAQPARSFVWSALESVSVSGLLFVVVIFMAQRLTPAEFGLAAVALAVTQPLVAVVESLFYEALIHIRDLTPRHVDTGFSVTLVLGILTAGLSWAAGAVLARLYEMPQIMPLTGTMGLVLLFSGLGAVPVACLRRDMQFKSLALRSILGRGLGAAIGLAAAFAGAGVWALVIQQVATAALGFVVILGSTERFPRPGFDRSAFTDIFTYGLPSVTTTVAFHLDVRLYSLLVGYSYGPAVLGYLNLSFRLIDGIRDLLHYSSYHLALPLLSRRRDDRDGLFRGFLKATRMASACTLPMFAATVVLAPDLVRVIVGPQWLPSVPMVRSIGIAACLYFLIDLAPIVFGTLRRPQISMKINLAGMAIGLIALSVTPAVSDSVPGLIWMGRYIVVAAITFACLRGVGLSVRQLAANTVPLVLCVAASCLAVWLLRGTLDTYSAVTRMAVGGLATVALAIATTALFMRRTLLDVWHFAASLAHRTK